MASKVSIKNTRPMNDEDGRAEQDERPAKAASKPNEISVTDDLGRVLVLKRPGPLAQFRLVKALGATVSQNTTYVSMLLPLLYVTSFDGERVDIESDRRAEFWIDALGDEGMAALIKGITDNFSVESAQELRDAAKK